MPAAAAPLLQMRGIEKRFGATRALAGVDLQLAAGQVLALLGENGAGKSTLMKVLSGVHRPDAGSMQLAGQPYLPADPRAARQQGVAMIYQELTLAPQLSIAENLCLGAEPRRAGFFIDRRALLARARGVLDELDLQHLDPETPVASLSLAQQQLIEVGRAMLAQARLLVFDEPSSSLGATDASRLFALIERLRAEGAAIIYISHFLEECRRVADDYVVLRDGGSVGAGRLASTDDAELIRQMSGRVVEDLYPRSHRSLGGAGEVVLEVSKLSGGAGKPEGVDLQLRAGEVLGIFGLIGSGRSELLRAVFGLDPRRSGTVRGLGHDFDAASPAQRWRHGLGMVSENRKEEGLFLDLSLADNLTAPGLQRCRRRGLLSSAEQRAQSRPLLADLAVAHRDPAQPAGELSGGNQQKVALARLLWADCRVLLLDEPTRGIDIAAKARIYAAIDAAAQQGRAVLLVSSYLPEVLGISDRIAVMHRGRLSAPRPVADWDHESLLAAALRGEAGVAA